MALFPIYGMFKGDFVPHLVAVDTDDTIDQVAEKVALHTVGRRLPVRAGVPLRVSVEDRAVPGDATLGQVIAQTGLKPLQWVHVEYGH
jgi:toluene monooxygenase system protein B